MNRNLSVKLNSAVRDLVYSLSDDDLVKLLVDTSTGLANGDITKKTAIILTNAIGIRLIRDKITKEEK